MGRMPAIQIIVFRYHYIFTITTTTKHHPLQPKNLPNVFSLIVSYLYNVLSNNYKARNGLWEKRLRVQKADSASIILREDMEKKAMVTTQVKHAIVGLGFEVETWAGFVWAILVWVVPLRTYSIEFITILQSWISRIVRKGYIAYAGELFWVHGVSLGEMGSSAVTKGSSHTSWSTVTTGRASSRILLFTLRGFSAHCPSTGLSSDRAAVLPSSFHCFYSSEHR